METIRADPELVHAVERRFVGLCLEIFGPEGVTAVVSHGSAVKGGLIPGFSDFDVLAFLTPDQFGPYGLDVDRSLAIQSRVDGLGARGAGFSYFQAAFYNPEAMPGWWTGLVPGAYRLLHGRLPGGLEATDVRLRESGVRALRQAGDWARGALSRWTDSHDAGLRREVRLLSTVVTPLVFAAVSFDRDDAASVWAADKFTALRLFEERYRDDPDAGLPRRFYEALFAIGPDEAPPDRYRHALRAGFRFLVWADRLARSLP